MLNLDETNSGPAPFSDVKNVVLGPRGGEVRNIRLSQQAWQEAPLTAETLPDGSPALHRFGGYRPTVTWPRKNEQPWHRMAAYMLLNGHTNREIAAAAGVHEATIAQLKAQRWFQELLATLGNQQGQAITGALQAEALASIETMVEIRDDIEAPKRVRLAAAVSLLEHHKGRPHQTVFSETVRRTQSPEERMAELQEDLANLRNAIPEVPSETVSEQGG